MLTAPMPSVGTKNMQAIVTTADERIALRGGACLISVQSPGALNFNHAPQIYFWNIGARAVLVP